MKNPRYFGLLLALWGSFFVGVNPAVAGTAFDLQLAQPHPGAGGFFVISSPVLHHHLDYSFGLNFNYSHKPLSLHIRKAGSEDEIGASLVGRRFDVGFNGALGLGEFFELGFVLPMIQQSGFDADAVEAAGIDLGATSIPEFTVGNLYLYPHVRLFEVLNGILQGSFLALVTVPLDSKGGFVHEDSVVAEPRLVLGGRKEGVTFSAYFGYRHRFGKEQKVGPLSIGNEATAGAGLGVEATAQLHLYTEGYAKFPVSALTEENSTFSEILDQGLSPAEWMAGTRYYVATASSIYLAVGVGVTPGYGVSTPRVMLGVKHGLRSSVQDDRDNDTIRDNHDQCIDEPEDLDGFEDSDGCPEGDNDQDKILDEDDSCPNEPEDRDGFGDEDGCPENDNDGDNVLDEVDKCPNDAEDADSFEDEDGCPELDNDSDGIADIVDQCPNKAEDVDGFSDTDGCPEADNDNDGLDDLSDLCPEAAEDVDGFQDDDGCPDDDDGDGIPDQWDQCPKKAENYNLKNDGDGCPDAGRSLIEVSDDTIVLKTPIRFKMKSAIPQKGTKRLLLQIVSVLRNYRHFQMVIIEAHAVVMGSEKKNLQLSRKRAEVIRKFLIKEGINPSRLVAEGVGSSRPLTRGKSKRARLQNERVELIIEVKKAIGFGYETQSGEKPMFEIGPDDGGDATNDDDIEFNF